MTAVTVSLVGLIVIIGVHIAVIARWSGKIEGKIDGFITNTEHRVTTVEEEIKMLRKARHLIDGKIQQYDAKFRSLERAVFKRRADDPIVEES